MPDKPILFSAPMIRAILDGRKTQTRRIAKLQNEKWVRATPEFDVEGRDIFVMCGAQQHDGLWPVLGGIVPPFSTGDHLWFREAWRTEARYDHLKPSEVPQGALISYEADYGDPNIPNDGCRGRYRHARFMCRWMSRIWGVVTDVRAQRLQDISEEDAIAEGLEWRDGFWANYHPDGRMICGGTPDPVEAYRCLWTNINGNGSWEANPWVVAYTFRPELRNIDARSDA